MVEMVPSTSSGEKRESPNIQIKKFGPFITTLKKKHPLTRFLLQRCFEVVSRDDMGLIIPRLKLKKMGIGPRFGPILNLVLGNLGP